MARTVTPRFTVTGAATALGLLVASALSGLSSAYAEGTQEARVAQLLKAAGIDPATVPEKDSIGIIAGAQKIELMENGQPRSEGTKNAPGKPDSGAAEAARGTGQGGLADPTRPPQQATSSATATAPAAPRGNRLQSVVYGPHRRVAILDGHEVREGTVVGASRVVQIQRDAVILETGAKRERLSLYPNVVKKPRPQLTTARKRAPRAKHHD